MICYERNCFMFDVRDVVSGGRRMPPGHGRETGVEGFVCGF